MKTTIRVLLIDDHPITIEAYKGALEFMEYDFNTTEAHDIDSALLKIKEQPEILPFDIAFVDIGLPQSATTSITSGEGLVAHLRKKFKQIKIIIPTLYHQSDRLHFILEYTNPDALLLKSDFRSIEIQQAVQAVLHHQKYYSKSVQKVLESKKLKLDPHDVKLLHCLSKGIKLKDMGHYIPLASRTIEERKNKLMILFNATNNEQLLKKAQEKGLL
jgi:DNA-binding NarL/FixJ family response regulator